MTVRRFYSTTLLTTALLAAVLILLPACAQEGAEQEAVEADEPQPTAATHSQMYTPEEATPAPDFERATYEGGTFRLSDHHGEVLVVNFWATWCMPCRVEMPEFIELQDDYGEEGLLFVGISLDAEGFEVAQPFAEEIGVNYPIVIDDGEIADMFGGVYGLPATFIIDRSGHIHKRINGRVHKEDLEPILTELLAETA